MSTLSEFEILKRLGEGSFGTVYTVKRKSDEKIYAMKKVKMLSLSTKEKENALNEVRILASIKSDKIISYKDAFYDESSSCLCIIMDFATKGDLLMQINEHKKKRTYFEEAVVWKYAADMLLGLKALHDKKILHRDLKGANVFISDDGSLKLGDLNVSKVQKRDYAYTQTGTPYYTSPEVWQNRPYDSKCDVWSLGCVLYEVVTLEPPFKGNSMEDLYKKVLRGNFTPINLTRYSSDLQKFLEQCLKVDPKMRSSVDALLTHKRILPLIDLDTIAANDRNRALKSPSNPDLLQTIKIPFGNLKGLNNRLPKPNYEPEEAKSDNIKIKKANEQRPFSAVNSQPREQPNINKNPIIPIQASKNNPIIVQNQPPQYIDPNIRLQSAQAQVKRVLSHNDLSSNQAKNQMPPISPIIINNNNINKQNYHYNMPYGYNHPYNQPKIAIHQEKDTNGYNPIRRSHSRDALYENNKNIANHKNPPYHNQQVPPQQRLQPLIPPSKMGGSPSQQGLPPKPLRNF